MEKTRCGDKADLIQKILVRLPVVSLLRFKAVSRSWYALIESSSFIDSHTTFKSSSSKFGSFILHAAFKFPTFRENALFMFSSVSEFESVSKSGSWCSESFGLWSTGFNGICGQCLSRYKSGGSGGLWWSTNDDGRCRRCGSQWNPPYRVAEDDDQVDRGGGGGGGGRGRVSNADDEQLVLKLDNLGFPSSYQFDKIRRIDIAGTCNGLICLHDSKHSDVSLWNPATRQFRILPKSSITIDGDDCLHRLVAFGFDAETKDYKVVLLSGLRLRERIIDGQSGLPVPMECLCRVQVYSLSTDSWSRPLKGINLLPGFPFSYPDSSSSSGPLLYLNGSCFFMAKFIYSEQCIPPEFNDRFIISLDLTKEIIIPIQLPHHHRDEVLYLCYLGKKIALFKTRTKVFSGTNSWQFFSIWVLNEHYSSSSSSVNQESWIEIHSFQVKHRLPDEWIIPRGISNDGVFALLETVLGNKKKMKLYNLVTKEVKKNFISCDQVLSNAYAYKPSLVSISGGSSSSYANRVIGKAAAEMDWKCISIISQG